MDIIFTIRFQVFSEAKDFGEAKGHANSLHEALCKSIHEGDEAASNWLNDNVLNIEALS